MRFLIEKLSAVRTIVGLNEDEIQALENPLLEIERLEQENQRLKVEAGRLGGGYRPPVILPRCINCGTGNMYNSPDGFTCGDPICRDCAVDIIRPVYLARNSEYSDSRPRRRRSGGNGVREF